jgi:hypothetical protein
MNVVFHAAHNDRLAIEIGKNAAEVTVQFLAQRPVAQKWSPVFGGENGVNQNLCERLRHGVRMREGVI